MADELDPVFKALADETRRTILDFLRNGPRTTTEIVGQFADLSRFAVMKHLDVLRTAELVVTREEGRQRINSLNAVPLQRMYERWVSRYEGLWASGLLRVKEELEGTEEKQRKPKHEGTKNTVEHEEGEVEGGRGESRIGKVKSR